MTTRLDPAIESRSAGPALLVQNLLLESELEQIVRACERRQLALVVLKGVPLTRRLHGRLDARQMVDNDILVRAADVQQAAECLRELGYRCPPHHTTEGDLRSNFQSAMLRETASTGRLWAEIHWSAFPPRMFDVPEKLQWSRTQEFSLKNVRVRVFDPAMTVVHLAAHFAQHCCIEPRILRDVGAAWDRWHREIDENDLRTLALATGVWPTLVYCLNAAQKLGWLEAPLPAFSSRRALVVGRLLPAQQLLAEEASLYLRTLYTALLLEPQRAAAWLLRQVVPPIQTMASIYERPISASLYLQYATRPFRGLKRVLRGEHRKATR